MASLKCGMTRYCFLILCMFSTLHGSSSDPFLFHIERGDLSLALIYYKSREDPGYVLLKKIAQNVIRKQLVSRNPEEQHIAAFAVSMTQDRYFFPWIVRLLGARSGQTQLIALHLLAKSGEQFAYRYMTEILGSPILPLRLEAAYLLASIQAPKNSSQIESLMFKLEGQVKWVFPQLYALQGDELSYTHLRKLLHDKDERTRIEAILQVGKFQIVSMLPDIRMLASHLNHRQQEACAFVLGLFEDTFSIPILERLRGSDDSNVKLASCLALQKMGSLESVQDVIQLAKQGNPFAVAALGEVAADVNHVLEGLLASPHVDVRLNAALALLEKGEAHKGVMALINLIIPKEFDLLWRPKKSSGGSMTYWQQVAGGKHKFRKNPYMFEISTRFREGLLEKIRLSSVSLFLKVAQEIFVNSQIDLVPKAMQLIDSIDSQDTIHLLESQSQRIGIPFIREYAQIMLFRKEHEVFDLEKMKEILERRQKEILVHLRPVLPWDLRDVPNSFELTPNEQSRLLSVLLGALATKKNKACVDLLIDTLENGNAQNQALVAAFLLHAAQ